MGSASFFAGAAGFFAGVVLAFFASVGGSSSEEVEESAGLAGFFAGAAGLFAGAIMALYAVAGTSSSEESTGMGAFFFTRGGSAGSSALVSLSELETSALLATLGFTGSSVEESESEDDEEGSTSAG